MKNKFLFIAKHLGIELPEDPPELLGIREVDRNLLLDLACKIAGTSNWSTLLRVHFPVIFLLADCAARIGLNQKEIENFALDLFEFLSRELIRNQKYTWPSQAHSPRYAFISCGYISKDRKIITRLDYSVLPVTFCSIAFDTIKGLLEIENKINKTSKVKTNIPDRCGLAARFLVQYSPNLLNTSLERILEDRSHAIEAFRARHEQHSLKSGYDIDRFAQKIENLRERYISRQLRSLEILWTRDIKFHNRRKPIHSRLQERNLKHRERTISGEGSDSTGSFGKPPSMSDLQASISLGIAPGEFSEIMVEGKRSHESSGSMWARLIRGAMIYRNEEAVAWGRNAPKLNDLAKCYKKWFSTPWEKNRPARQLAIFKAMMYLHHGILPESLTQIRIGTRRSGRKLLKQDGIFLDKDRLTLVQLIPVYLEPSFLLGQKRWQDLGIVEVALNPLLHSMLLSLLQHYPLGKTGERWIAPYSRTPVVMPKGGVSPLGLCQAYESYYSLRYGLDPELASLIAGRPVLGRNSSVHYFRSTHQRLHQEHRRAFDRFHNEIIQVCQDSAIAENLPKPFEGKAKVPTGSVGSLFYPDKKKLTAYLHDLRKGLENTWMMGNRRAWRDLLGVYTYECLRLVTGMRVLQDPDFHEFSIMGHGNWLRLQEKGRYSRIVPVHEIVANLWRMLAEENYWQQHDGFHSPNYERPIFYFIDSDGFQRPLSSHTIKTICQEHHIDHPDFKSNAHRHLMRSHIFECGLSYRIADFILGHLHGGPHPSDRLSLIPPEQRRRQFLRVADSLVKELNIIQVRPWR